MTEPRLISAAQLRMFLGCGPRTVRQLRKHGLLPDPLPGTRLYDLKAVERALDRASDPGAQSVRDEQELIQRARRWGRSP